MTLSDSDDVQTISSGSDDKERVKKPQPPRPGFPFQGTSCFHLIHINFVCVIILTSKKSGRT